MSWNQLKINLNFKKVKELVQIKGGRHDTYMQ